MSRLLDVMNASGEELTEFSKKADEIRRANHGDIITYSKNVFLPVTNLCRNRCGYCGFRKDEEEASILNAGEVEVIARDGARHGCKEALFTFGERPEIYGKMKDFLMAHRYDSFRQYLHTLSENVIELGLLPHTNGGALSKSDMQYLKEVNASMGLMLENVSERLCKKGMPHEFSPGKDPEVRMQTIKDAGRLKIPFTTGLLIGIGETNEEIVDSLMALKDVQDKYGHIQEIIIQNFNPKSSTPMDGFPPPSATEIIKCIIATRLLFKDMNIQVPPNLNQRHLDICLQSGANDLGGISPVTRDYINPEHEWPSMDYLRKISEKTGLRLKERLPIYPKYVEKGWYSDRLSELIMRYADADGYVKEGYACLTS